MYAITVLYSSSGAGTPRTPTSNTARSRPSYPGVDVGHLYKSISRISGTVHAQRGGSGTWGTNSIIHVLDFLFTIARRRI